MENRTDTWLLPLSGDVMQAINPWSWWTNAMGQFGLINISSGASANPRLEREIVGKVASYGRQLGRINDALYALLAHQDPGELSAVERHAVDEFRRMADAINAVKEGHAAPTDAALDGLIEGIRFLRDRNPKEYARVVGRLRHALFETKDAEVPGARPAEVTRRARARR
jgi:hypothetical protein